MSPALKECPYCGSPAALEDHRTVWAVKCTSSACATIMLGERAPEPDGEMGDAYWNGIKQTAIDRWNTRAIAPPVAAGSVDTVAMPVFVECRDARDFWHERAEKAEADLKARDFFVDVLNCQVKKAEARVKELEEEISDLKLEMQDERQRNFE